MDYALGVMPKDVFTQLKVVKIVFPCSLLAVLDSMLSIWIYGLF